MSEVLRKPIQAFSVGRHKDSNGKILVMSPAELTESVAYFNQSGERIPMVPGHPRDDSPVGGFATKLKIINGRAHIIEADEINPFFRGAVNNGELNRVSVKFLLPSHPDNPSGTYLWKHIGFLGRSRPALDLETAQFSSSEGEILLMADDNDDFEAEFAKREAEFAKREAEFAAQKKAFDKAREFEPFVEGLVRTGQIPPAQKSGFVALFSALPDEQSAEFAAAEGEKQSPADFLKAHLSKLPQDIIYSEVSKPDGREDTPETAFMSNGGKDDDSGELSMHNKIVASGVDPKDSTAYAAAVKKHMKGGK